MSDELTGVVDADDRERLIEEISLLRAKVARLQERVEQLDQLAHRDSLIDLPNRRGFMRELERLIARVDRYGINAAMLFVDLDGLKMINDSFGHRAGDEALIQVATCLRAGFATAMSWRGSAATSSASCSKARTRTPRTRPRAGSSIKSPAASSSTTERSSP